ncbi:DUF3347 domain-containing protein [Chitinophaga sp. 30R24]|uniref:DUF3347 domain-containing protein n=1 Tax=Chitinophaga sp. 30R24 TaxID=3248838 RepID=UPI003B9153B2
MKPIIKWAILALIIIFFAACGGSNTGKSENKDTASTRMDENSISVAVIQLKDDKLNAVYQHYVHLTTALINGDDVEAKIASNAIETGAKEIAGGKGIEMAAAKIIAAKDIEEQRAAYSSLSSDFISLVKKSGLNSGELYVDFCPMAMNDKGAYWLSENKEIKNPYLGEKMMTCGDIKDSIK